MITSILVAMTVALAPAVAEPRGAAPEPAPIATPAPADARRYCIVDTITGSRVPKRVCLSRAKWLEQGYDPLKGE